MKVEMTTKEIKELYKENKDFAEYVEAFAKSRQITVGDAMEWAIIRERALDLVNRY